MFSNRLSNSRISLTTLAPLAGDSTVLVVFFLDTSPLADIYMKNDYMSSIGSSGAPLSVTGDTIFSKLSKILVPRRFRVFFRTRDVEIGVTGSSVMVMFMKWDA